MGNLKECPRCRKANIRENDVQGEIWFKCNDCGLSSEIVNFSQRDELIAAWNHRALPEDAIREAAEEIAKYIVHHTHSAFGNVAGDWNGSGIESIIRRH